jgi:hypothetical protein
MYDYMNYDARKDYMEFIVSAVKSGNTRIGHTDSNLFLAGVYDYRRHGKEEKSKKEMENGYYKYIPYSRDSFINLVVDIQKKNKAKRFIDVGSGIGDKVILAYIFGNFDKVSGVELNETTYHVSKYFLEGGMLPFEKRKDYFKDKKELEPKTKINLLNVDAFDYDFSNDDFIYMYVPISTSSIMHKLHLKILKEMPIKGIIVDVGANDSIQSAIFKLKYSLTDVKEKNLFYNYYKKTGKEKFEYHKLIYSSRW